MRLVALLITVTLTNGLIDLCGLAQVPAPPLEVEVQGGKLASFKSNVAVVPVSAAA